MTRTFEGEIWKELKFDVDYVNYLKIEVSNFGRVRRFSRLTDGKILAGGTVNGYKIVRFKLFAERDEKSQHRIDYLREQIAMLVRQVGKLRTKYQAKRVKDKAYFDLEKTIKQQDELLATVKKNYQKELKRIENARSKNIAYLVHRLVAEYFVDRPSPDHSIVAHLDYNKQNNHYSNVKWLTKKEHVIHREKSPLVIKSRQERFGKHYEGTKVYKLTSTKVMLIKKKINQGTPLRTLAKTFKVSETQLLRIKRGENWGNIEAAK